MPATLGVPTRPNLPWSETSRNSLAALLPLLTQRLAGRADAYAALRETARREQKARRARLAAAAEAAFDAPVIAPLVAAREIAGAIGPDIAIIDEAPATSLHLRGFLNSNSTRQYSFSRGGALGWGMPAAVGYSLGIDRAPVVSIVGDGAALYSPQALWTAARENLPVTFVVVNNREYNILKNFMKAQPHYASVRANHFIAMDLVKPRDRFFGARWRHGRPRTPDRPRPRHRSGAIGDGANRVLDGDRGIGASRTIDVDVVHAQSLQRISDEIAERDRTIVEPIQSPIRIAQHAKLDAQNCLVAPASSERLADQHLIVARPVEVASIQQIDFGVERSLNRRDTLSTIRRAAARRSRPTSPCIRDRSRIPLVPWCPVDDIASKRSFTSADRQDKDLPDLHSAVDDDIDFRHV